jgi:hypothetical protein
MWIFTKDAFLSIVDKGATRGDLMVRGRAEGDIERVFPGAKVVKGAGTDYLFRASIPRKKVAEVIAEQIMSIDYLNFKGATTEDDRHDAYFGAWRSMMAFQTKRDAPSTKRKKQNNLF